MASKHDQAVRNTANWYRNHGYRVNADIPGFNQPRIYNGSRPDVVASRPGDRVLVEVETPRSLKPDVPQRRALSSYARRHNARFRTIVTR